MLVLAIFEFAKKINRSIVHFVCYKDYLRGLEDDIGEFCSQLLFFYVFVVCFFFLFVFHFFFFFFFFFFAFTAL